MKRRRFIGIIAIAGILTQSVKSAGLASDWV